MLEPSCCLVFSLSRIEIVGSGSGLLFPSPPSEFRQFFLRYIFNFPSNFKATRNDVATSSCTAQRVVGVGPMWARPSPIKMAHKRPKFVLPRVPTTSLEF